MMDAGIMNSTAMPLSLPLVFCLLASLEGIVCRNPEFILENFSTADIYSTVEVVGSGDTRQFILKKDNSVVGVKQHFVLFSAIIFHSLTVEVNGPRVVSFYVRGEYYANYNIKFENVAQTRHFAILKMLPAHYVIHWARVYSSWRPSMMAYENLDDGDIGFKVLDHGNYPDPIGYLYEQPYYFKRSEIENEIKTRTPQTLYLRSKKRKEDYEIKFRSRDDLGAFLQLLPQRKYDDDKTVGYYFIPYSI